MRFKRWKRFSFEDTSRKRVALRRKQQKEREGFPLLAEQIAGQQPGEDEVMRLRAEAWELDEIRTRGWRARKWREARSIFASYSDNKPAATKFFAKMLEVTAFHAR